MDRQLVELTDEVRLLYHSMARFADEAHAERQVRTPMRAVLEHLDRFGETTVPRIAQARGVSRQHIQVIVNDLVRAGLVEVVDNPAHRRSRLVGLTSTGTTIIGEMLQAERELLRESFDGLQESDLISAHNTLNTIRCRLDEIARALEHQ